MVQSVSVLYVNAITGNDANSGTTASSPLKTLTRALQKATSGTMVQLAPGQYTQSNGERFPVVIPPGVQTVGNEANKGNGIVIEGGGTLNSLSAGAQNVTIQMGNEAQLRGVTVTNRASQGTGVWIESATPTLANNTFVNCGREAIFVTGSGNPLIRDNVFRTNTAQSVLFNQNAKGEMRGNVCQNTVYGITIRGNAAPLVWNNQVSSNRIGVLLADAARPVFRTNIIERNTESGLSVTNQAIPDLGQPQDPGENLLRDNGTYDLQNSTGSAIASVGNLLNPVRVQGLVNYLATDLINTFLPTTPTPTPTPTPPTPPTPVPTGLTDISGHWAQAFIQGLFSRGLISGFPDSTFRPNNALTRAEFAAILAKAFQVPDQQAAIAFSDVPRNFWASEAIAQATRRGFLAGFPDGSFRPNQNLTRVQAIVALINGLNLTGGNLNVLSIYSDRAAIPSYATSIVATATQRRIIVNYPNTQQLRPLVDITRGEVSAFIYQALVATGRATAIASPFIVEPNPTGVTFSDINNHWAQPFIVGLANQNLVNGFADGSYRPNLAISRAEYASLLIQILNPQPQKPAIIFRDVPTNFWAANAVQLAYRSGFLSGYPDGSFRPDEILLRVQVLLSLANGLALAPANLQVLNGFDDRNTIPLYAREGVAATTAKGFVVNYPQVRQLNPNGQATRAEVTAILYQVLVDAKRLSKINSPYIVTV